MKTIIMLLIAATTINCGFEIVDTGYRGIKTRFGEVQGDPLPEGFHGYNPLTSDIIELDVREKKWENETMAYTKDVQNVDVVFTVNYYPDPSYIGELYKNVGYNWDNKLVPQIVKGKIKEVVGQYEAVQLVSDRQAATLQIEQKIEEELKTKRINLKNFEITNLDFNDAFESAVEQKVVAIQQAEEAKNKTVRIQEEAKQKIISAKAEAKSMQIRSEALSKNKALVEYEAVQKWDGKMPTYMMGGAVPFINLGSAQ